MDNSLQDSRQPISDDQELAKALAGISDEPEQAATPPAPMPEMPGVPALEGFSPEQVSPTPTPQPSAPVAMPGELTPAPVVEPTALPSPVPPAPEASSGGELDDIKKNALNELRPLVDRVNLDSEEKFDIYLMLIRSTDDKSLIAPAHSAAQGIEDEKKKAQALLDIIKEIDYLSRKDQKQQ